MLRAIIILSMLLPTLSYAEMSNTLKANPSPYLAMHGNDPVKWQQWNSETVARAKAENKLLFVSIGYFACHWCHVMQKESYQAVDIAKVLNSKFIPVKVDRELNPALDARLIEFVNRTRGYSGWPLNVFITPEGYPLFGLVYLPHDDFKALVEKLARYWDEDSTGLIADAKLAASELVSADIDFSKTLLSDKVDSLAKNFVKRSLNDADKFLGGFGEQSKFPSVPRLVALLTQYQKTANKELGKFLKTTLNSMQKYGLNDSLGGGFFRYTVDPQWRVPHFEKMLYDNALLASLYFDAAKIFDRNDYRATAIDTTRFMYKTLGTKNGGLVASLSAVDDKNIEGGYYLWDRDEIKAILNKREWAVVEPAWNLFGTATLEGLFLPVAVGGMDELAKEKTVVGAVIKREELSSLLESARSKLLKVREKRGLPVDTKRLAAWNGLALSALLKAAKLTKNKQDQQAAKHLRDFLANKLWDGKQLVRARNQQGKPIAKATIEDYAFVAAGLLDWAVYTNQQADYKLATDITAQAWRRFFNKQGWKLSEENLLAYGLSEHAIADGPMPSPSAVILRVTQAILKRDSKSTLAKKYFKAALVASEKEVLDDPFWFSSYVAVLERGRE